MAKRTIRHGIFTWQEGPTNKVAFHGETVDIENEGELKRGEREGAFFPNVGDEFDRSEMFGDLLPLPVDHTDEQIKAYLAGGTAAEIVQHAAAYAPSTIAKLI